MKPLRIEACSASDPKISRPDVGKARQAVMREFNGEGVQGRRVEKKRKTEFETGRQKRLKPEEQK
jgi:hypothetical protein